MNARKWFTGPKITVDVQGMTEEQKRALITDGVNIGSGGMVLGGASPEVTEKEKREKEVDSA